MNLMPPASPIKYEANGLKNELLIKMLEDMKRIRLFEETLSGLLFPKKLIGTPCHLCVGQEAIAVGICSHLHKSDFVFGNHRSHGHYLAKGGDIKLAMAEIFCKSTGCSGGRGGSMHLVSPENGILGTSSIVSGSVPLAVGAGMAIDNTGTNQISVIFHGDGVPEEGSWNESANFASINNLPVLFVCENNLYCTHLPLSMRRKRDNLAELAEAHGLHSYIIDGNNIIEMYITAQTAIDRIRNGNGPVFLECRTYRWLGHVGPFDNLEVGLRSEEELSAWKMRCPIKNFTDYLIDSKIIDDNFITKLDDKIKREIYEAIDFAKRSSFPEKDVLKKRLYPISSKKIGLDRVTEKSNRLLSYCEAINEGHDQAMQIDEMVMVIGQGVDNPWCVGNSTRGLQAKFGSKRVRDVPICENAMTGAAIGSSMAGLRPIVFHPRMDFMYLAMDQIINHCAIWNYMFNGKVNVPVVIRGIINRGGQQGAQHSQSPYSMFCHVPGLKVVAPSTPYDAKGLLLSAVLDNGPVIFIDDRWLYAENGIVPEQPYTIPLGKGNVIRPGNDITVVAISYLVPEALRCAEELELEGISVEIVDPRTLMPLDYSLILESVKKTKLLLIADPAWPYCGLASEISSEVMKRLWHSMKMPATSITLPGFPAPASISLEESYYPRKSDIRSAILNMLG